MLIIESVNPTGMFSFGACQNIDLLNKGLVSLVGVNHDMYGDSNGSGKSSGFNAVCEIAYQKNPTEVSGDAVINTVWGQGFSGRVVFTSWEAIKYRVTYCRKQKKPVYVADNDNRTEYTGTALYFDKLIGGQWVDCRAEGMEPTKKLIRAALGLTYDQFVAVAYMTPRQGNVLLRGANKARMDVLSGLVGLDAWDTLAEAIKRERTLKVQTQVSLEKQAAYIEGQLTQLLTQAASQSVDTVNAELTDAQTKLIDVRGLKQNSETNLETLKTQLQELDAAKATAWTTLGLDTHAGTMASMVSEIADLRVDRANCRTSINPELATEFNTVETELNVARGTLAAVKGENNLVSVENCPTCGTRITKTARVQMAKSIKTAEKAVSKCEAQVKAVQESVERDRLQQETGIAHRQREIDAQLTALEIKKAEATDAHSASMVTYNEFDPRVTQVHAEINQVQMYIVECHAAVVNWQSRIEALSKTLKEIDALKDQVSAKQVEYEAKQLECQALVNDLAHYTWFTTNIPYIKLHKLSVALADLSDLANGYLHAMGDTARIKVSSFKEKKKATSELKIDSLKGEISVTITDGQKDIDPRLYSDGETARFSAALVRAVHDLAVKHGQGCNLVLLDEIFSYVDANNSQKIADSFTSDLQADSTYIVTDNSGAAADLMEFDSVWTVTKEQGLSQLTTGE